MFDIDKKDDSNEHGYTALHYAIECKDPITVELLLKDYHANPNVVDNENHTTLMCWASIKDRNLYILRLLVKYRFDFARLVNQCDIKDGRTALHWLCVLGDTDHNIVCLKHVFSICEKIPNCSINILARNHNGWTGLHDAIYQKDVDMTKYLLENVFFPNSDKLNKDGIAFINMKIKETVSLAGFVMQVLAIKKDCDERRDLEMFKLLASYGMKFNSADEIYFEVGIIQHHIELFEFILNQNLCPIYTLEKIIWLMYKVNGQKDECKNRSQFGLKTAKERALLNKVNFNEYLHSLQYKHNKDDNSTNNVVNMQLRLKMIDSIDEFELTNKELGYFGVFCNNKETLQQHNKNKSKNENVLIENENKNVCEILNDNHNNKNINNIYGIILSNFATLELKYQFDTFLFDQCGNIDSPTYVNLNLKS